MTEFIIRILSAVWTFAQILFYIFLGFLALTLWIAGIAAVLPIVLPFGLAYGLYRSIEYFVQDKESKFLEYVMLFLMLAAIAYIILGPLVLYMLLGYMEQN